MVVGPFRQVQLPEGGTADLFILRYGPEGELLSPRTAEILHQNTAAASDIFLFSHGWNNTFDDATRHYLDFAEKYTRQTSRRPAGYRPLLIGIVWPSISFLMPWEDGPQIAAAVPSGPHQREEMRGFVAAGLSVDVEARLSELIDGRDGIPADEAREAVEIVRDAVVSAEGDDISQPTVDELLTAWATLDRGEAAKPRKPDAFRDAAPVASSRPTDQPQAAASVFDVRNLLRMGTVWKMKDRAGTVGGKGVSPLVVRILQDTSARMHLVGHSFGARVVLSALAMRPLHRKARSVLLLQPAINRWCFAPDVPGRGRPGGYFPVLDRVELPILSTMSTHDFPLHDVFHLALRGGNLGEPNVAAFGDFERYGALGGYGPAGLGTKVRKVAMVAPGTAYDLTGDVRVIVLDGSGNINRTPAIGGHSDVVTVLTTWALHNLAGG
jgi:hypothetical protein